MKKIVLALFLLAANFSIAQRNFTIEEATMPSQYGFYTEDYVGVQWKSNQEITYLSPTYQHLMIQEVYSKEGKQLITKGEIQEVLNQRFSEDQIALNIFPYDYIWVDDEVLQFTANGKSNKYAVQYDVVNKKIVKHFALPKEAEEEDYASDFSFVTWLKDGNIYITDQNGKTTQVTNDGAGVINGSSNTHRNEFGINKGLWISPDSKKILFYSKDERMVTDYPLTDFSTRVAEHTPIKYPMAGMKSEEVTLKVYTIETKQTLTLNIDGPKEQFLTMPTWTPSSNEVLVGVLNRGQDHLKVQLYNATTGNYIRTLFEQKASTYVEPSHPFTFLKNNDNQFVYVTDKGGYRQMYLYNLQGKEVRSLGFKDVVFKSFVASDSQYIYYMGTANKGMDMQLYKVNIKSGKTEQLTKTSGIHQTVLNPDKTLIYNKYTNATSPNVLQITDSKGKVKNELLVAKNPYEPKINLPKVEYVSIEAADGKTQLNGRLTYPVDFSEDKTYPVMIYVYGGPHAQLVTNRFNYGATGFDYYMAQQGFVVFTLDNRGSDNRGKDFEHVIHRNLGQHEMQDQMKGVEYLTSLPFVDKDKIGVYGWSYGGFMTTSLMLHYPEVFKVGVAGGPVIDWKWYEVMYGERYMDTPEENPEGYALTSTLDKVDQLQGRLLMIHGAQDPVVLQQHSMAFIEACIKAGKQVDYFLYPTHEHNVMGKDRIHLNQKIADYFIQHLKK